jgi:microcystin-dependent protein
MPLTFRNGNEADLNVSKLMAGEPAYCTDSKKLFIGNGDGTAYQVMTAGVYAKGNGASNENKVDHSIYADTAGHANGIIGEIKFSPTGKALDGTFLCDGSTFDATKYPKLYAFLGTNTLPDMRGCVIGMYGGDLGTGIGKVGSATHTHGSSGMSANIAISGTEIAAQQSSLSFNYNVYASLSCYSKNGDKPNGVKIQGNTDAASNIQPTYVGAFCIVHD